MDRKRTKRPRNSTPSSTRKKKKTKPQGSTTTTEESPTKAATAEERTTTPESSDTLIFKMMATFSSSEHQMLQAFRRSTLQGDVVQAYLTRVLRDRFRVDDSYRLEDMVSPGQSQEIVRILRLCGKIYAQRLVVQAAQECQNNNNNNTTTSLLTAIWNAHHARTQSGEDPGFYMQQKEGDSSGPSEDTKRLAAEHAQEEYDKLQEEKAKDSEAMEVEEE